ncbi:MAG: oligosaccharide flippase family protein [Bacteroidales bacterium]|nr:oligosaccharide flippase family protein [Bacteroidales bacterium]
MNVFRIINGDMHFRELFRGSTIAFVFRLVSALASYIFFYFLAQLYGPKGVGVSTTSWTILMISSVVGKMGFDTSIVKFIAESAGSRSYLSMRKIYRSGLRIILLSASVVAIILMALSGYVTEWFYETVSDNWVVILVGLSVIPYSLMSYNAESLKGLKRILPFSVHQNVTIYFGALVLLFIVNSFYGYKEAAIIALVIILLILMTSSFITLRIYLKRYPNHDSHYSPDIPGPRKIINTTLPMMMTNSLFLVMNWTDVLMLANMTSRCSCGNIQCFAKNSGAKFYCAYRDKFHSHA